MRPIKKDKGGRGTYPYTLNSNLSGPKYSFTKKPYSAPAKRVYGQDSASIAECLETWLTVAKVKNDQLVAPNNLADLQSLTKAIKSRVGETYGKSANRLFGNLGEFCSYCEIPLPSTVEVEHVTPKAQYPEFSVAWENFTLACGPCNKRPAKGDQPSRKYVVQNWLGNVQPVNEMDYYTEVRDHYLWPDTDEGSYQLLLPQLEFLSTQTGKWKAMPFDRSVRLDMRHDGQSNTTKKVHADIYINDTKKAKREVRVMLQDTNASANAMIKLCLLNSPGSTTGGLSDRRRIQRTEAWFDILAKIEFLMWAAKQDPGSFNMGWGWVMTDAKKWGFYSVWARIFQLTKLKDPTGTLLFTRFVNDTNVQGYFPNTDAAEMFKP
jgi:5-methylcytosine-specific restriction endonuclease McrA